MVLSRYNKTIHLRSSKERIFEDIEDLQHRHKQREVLDKTVGMNESDKTKSAFRC